MPSATPACVARLNSESNTGHFVRRSKDSVRSTDRHRSERSVIVGFLEERHANFKTASSRAPVGSNGRSRSLSWQSVQSANYPLYALPSRGPRKYHRIKPSSGSTTTRIQSADTRVEKRFEVLQL